jgi:hypothetical protein
MVAGHAIVDTPKTQKQTLLDEVEDGGRAAVIEEGIAALAFNIPI